MQIKAFPIFLYISLSCLVILCNSCKNNSQSTEINQEAINNPQVFHNSVKALTDVIVHDIFSPPVASRIYAYASIGAYEAGRHSDSTLHSLAGKIKHLPPIPQPSNKDGICFPMAASIAFLQIGKVLIFSEDTLQKQLTYTVDYYKNTGLSQDVLDATQMYADTVTKYIIQWSALDNYKQSRSFPKYTINDAPDTWRPTPPAYMDGLEPSWKMIRPFVLASSESCLPGQPTKYNMTDKKSTYFKETMEVYDAVKNATEEQIEIANFWDCNPYKLNIIGHVMHATKKITPGGHWINIVGQACKKSQQPIAKSAFIYATVSVALADAFISCWDEKYRSNCVRPETVINQHIDPVWQPLLQTPPFPEYTSGHSVASTAAAYILTNLLGDNFAYTDSTEVEFGLPARNFTSFVQASEEACISRLYGGIHFMPSIKNGQTQGKCVADLVSRQLLDTN